MRDVSMKSSNACLSLKTRHEVDEKRMTDSVCYFKDVSLWHEAVDFFSRDHITLLQCFDGKVFASLLVLCQQYLHATTSVSCATDSITSTPKHSNACNIITAHSSVVVAWHSGNALVSINVVTLRQARLVLGWVTVCGRVNHLGMKPATQVNSAFHPFGVGKSSTSLHWLGLRRGVFACAGWQVILCDPIWQATPRSFEMDF